MEPLEKEEAFYRYEEGKMSRQTGFYVYYEKNEPMHNFLIAQNEKLEKKTEEVDDSAVHNFRKKVEKNISQDRSKPGFPVMKTAAICAAVAVLAVGVLYLNDYQKMQSAREVLAGIDQEKQETTPEETVPVNGSVSGEDAEEEEKDAGEENTEDAGENEGADMQNENDQE